MTNGTETAKTGLWSNAFVQLPTPMVAAQPISEAQVRHKEMEAQRVWQRAYDASTPWPWWAGPMLAIGVMFGGQAIHRSISYPGVVGAFAREGFKAYGAKREGLSR